MNKPARTSLVAVGQILRGVGIRGEVKLLSLSQDASRFKKLGAVRVGKNESETQKLVVESVRFLPTSVVLKFEGIDSRTQADQFRGQFVYVPQREAVKPSKGSFFIHDIMGMKVMKEDGMVVGTVKEVYQLPANDVWVVEQDAREIMLPAIKDVIKSVDVERGVIVIRPMEGLLDL